MSNAIINAALENTARAVYAARANADRAHLAARKARAALLAAEAGCEAGCEADYEAAEAARRVADEALDASHHSYAAAEAAAWEWWEKALAAEG